MLVYLHTIFKWQIFPFSAFSVRSYFLLWHSLILIVITLAECVICNAFIHDQLKCDRRHRSHCEWIFISLSLSRSRSWIEFSFDLNESKHSPKKTTPNWQRNCTSLYISIYKFKSMSIVNISRKCFLYVWFLFKMKWTNV